MFGFLDVKWFLRVIYFTLKVILTLYRTVFGCETRKRVNVNNDYWLVGIYRCIISQGSEDSVLECNTQSYYVSQSRNELFIMSIYLIVC